jgi:hypothetical protein
MIMRQPLTTMYCGQLFRTPLGKKVRFTCTRKVGPGAQDLEAQFEYVEAGRTVGGKAMPDLLGLTLKNAKLLVEL